MAPTKKTGTKKTGTKKPAAKSLAKTVAAKKRTSQNVVSAKKGDQRADVKKATKKTSTSAPNKKTATKATPKKVAVKEKAKKQDGSFRCTVSGIVVKSEKPNISEKTLLKLKDLLLEERVKHANQMEDLLQDADDLIADREGGDTVFDEESGEGDSVAVERERSLYLAAETKRTLDQIDSALERIKNKTYGVCGPSSRRISVDRLSAIPWTDICFDCKTRSERRL